VFGRDYETRDGTCVRDYIHVFDLAQAHVQALEWMEAHAGQHLICNLGTEQGKSVQEMLDAIGRVTGREVPYEDGPRRAGDPAVLVASNERAEEEPGWETTRSDIDTIVRDAWAWHSRHPEGYGD
jgi:UDP-glucose 4-epimerase